MLCATSHGRRRPDTSLLVNQQKVRVSNQFSRVVIPVSQQSTNAIIVRPQDLQLPSSMPLPMRKDWGIGMVGFGEFARRAHAPDYQRAGWKVAAVAVRDAASQQ